ncbi:MAG: hypothetical protein WC758_06715 [Candidatus Woesearchaeota archaeon]|jgi:hypothetical protein
MFHFSKKVEFKEQLEVTRSFLESNVGAFPKYKCHLSAEFLKRTMGLEVKVGIYIPENIRIYSEQDLNIMLCSGHAWNYSPEQNRDVDLTYDQFTNNSSDRIKILKVNDKSLRELSDGWIQHMIVQNGESFKSTIDYLVDSFKKEEFKLIANYLARH